MSARGGGTSQQAALAEQFQAENRQLSRFKLLPPATRIPRAREAHRKGGRARPQRQRSVQERACKICSCWQGQTEGSVVLPGTAQGKALAKVISSERKVPSDYCRKSLRNLRLRFSAVLRDHRSFRSTAVH